MKLRKCIEIAGLITAVGAPAAAAPSREELPATEATARDHGPGSTGFGHSFQWAPREYPNGQVGLHFGLTQPLLLAGLNVAADVHLGRWVFEYSHGMNLDYNRLEELMLTEQERAQGLDLDSPWTTGFGVGFRVIDELYPMLEVKAHHYVARVADDTQRYTTVSIGPAIAHRLFLYDGVFVNTYFRYWPNVWTNRSRDMVAFDSGLTHDALDLGFFANLSVGYAVDLE